MIQFKNHHLTVFQSALFCTTSTVIETSDLVLVVDPNWLSDEVETIRHFVEKIKGNRPVYLLFTHSDYDHIIGWRAFPDAKVIASQAFVENPDKEKILEQIHTFDDEYYISRDYEIAYPRVDFPIQKEGETLSFGNTQLTFYHAKGHNSDGIFTIVNNQYWIAGDYFCEVEFPYIYHSSVEYEATLAKTAAILKEHSIEYLIPGHGTVATSNAEILKRKQDALKYIHELRDSVKMGKHFDLDNLWRYYKFPRIMKKFHAANIELMQKEG
ncbi:MAG: hydroxyacylglutathione hydrolase [Paraglaciecola sp.]|jgi:hydroxyacylglutathione hydrolase